MEEHVEALKTNSEANRIDGYAEERGTRANNKQLSHRYAGAIADSIFLSPVLLKMYRHLVKWNHPTVGVTGIHRQALQCAANTEIGISSFAGE